MGKLDGKVAFITGGARGQGRSHAVTFAREGADIAVCDVCQDLPPLRYPLSRPADLDETVKQVRALGRRCIGMVADVRNAAQIEAAVNETIATFGKIDILANNAGILPAGWAEEIGEDEWDLVLDICMKGVWLTSKYVIPHMIRQKSGCIISTGSVAALKGFANFCHYIAAKHGVVGITRALAVELAEFNIRVNCVCPGHLNSPMTDGVALYAGMDRKATEEFLIKTNLFPRLLEPEDSSNAYLWLASDEQRCVTGTVVLVDNGFIQKSAG